MPHKDSWAYIDIPFDNFIVVSLGNYLPIHTGCGMHAGDSSGNILESDDLWLRQCVLYETAELLSWILRVRNFMKLYESS